MSVTGSNEIDEGSEGSVTSSTSDDDFRLVFGGAVPVSTPWEGLTFICCWDCLGFPGSQWACSSGPRLAVR